MVYVDEELVSGKLEDTKRNIGKMRWEGAQKWLWITYENGNSLVCLSQN